MAEKTTIICKPCGHVNEGERVYCHNCGAKLDRSLLPADEKTQATMKKEQKRIRKMVSPSRGFFAGAGKKLAGTLIWAVLVAAVVQIARQPDDVPPLPREIVDTPPVRLSLENLIEEPGPRKLVLKEDEINAYLRNTVRSRSTGLIGDEVKFVRTFVKLNEDEIRITTQPSLFNYPLYGAAYYRLEIRDNALRATCTGGNFGRMPVDPRAMQYLDIVFKQLWGALSKEQKLLDGAQAVDVHKGFIEVTSRQAAQ